MNSANGRTRIQPDTGAPPRWHRIYFWLAGFDVLTVTVALLLTHRIMATYQEFRELNHRWMEQLGGLSHLFGLAVDVNQPGNRVFENEQIGVEKAALDTAREKFACAVQRYREHLATIATVSQLERLEGKLNAAEQAMQAMTSKAEEVFDHLRKQDRNSAGKAMAEMDLRHADVNKALEKFRDEVGEIQQEYFDEHTAIAARYQTHEAAIAAAILLMAGGATCYGWKLAQQAAAHTQALRDSELWLEQRVRARTAELVQANSALREGEERYRALAKRVLTAQEDERRRIAHDLHDEIGQSLTSLLIGLRTAAEAPSFEAARERLHALRAITSSTLDEVRRLARGLRPSVLDDLGLRPALERYAQDYAQAHGLLVTVQAPDLVGRLPDEVETTLYRIVQEALTNTARHAQAHHVQITATRTPRAVAITVADDGCGFDCAEMRRGPSAHRHLGLSGMHERAAMLNGKVDLSSTPGQGTTVRVTLPLTEERDGQDSRAARG